MLNSNGPSAKLIELRQIRLFIRFHANFPNLRISVHRVLMKRRRNDSINKNLEAFQ